MRRLDQGQPGFTGGFLFARGIVIVGIADGACVLAVKVAVTYRCIAVSRRWAAGQEVVVIVFCCRLVISSSVPSGGIKG